MVISHPLYPYSVDTNNIDHREFFRNLQISVYTDGHFNDWAREEENITQAKKLFPIPENSDLSELLEFCAWVYKVKLPDDPGPFAFSDEVFKSWKEVYEKYEKNRAIPGDMVNFIFNEWLEYYYPFGIIIDPDK